MISWLNGSIVVQAPWSFLLSCTVQVSWTHCCPPQAHLPCPAICLAHSAWFCISRASQSLLFLCSMASEVFTDCRIKFKFLSLASKVYDLILIYISRCFLHCPSTCILNAKHHQSQNSLCDLLPGSLITSDFLPRTLTHVPFAIVQYLPCTLNSARIRFPPDSTYTAPHPKSYTSFAFISDFWLFQVKKCCICWSNCFFFLFP